MRAEGPLAASGAFGERSSPAAIQPAWQPLVNSTAPVTTKHEKYCLICMVEDRSACDWRSLTDRANRLAEGREIVERSRDAGKFKTAAR